MGVNDVPLARGEIGDAVPTSPSTNAESIRRPALLGDSVGGEL